MHDYPSDKYFEKFNSRNNLEIVTLGFKVSTSKTDKVNTALFSRKE